MPARLSCPLISCLLISCLIHTALFFAIRYFSWSTKAKMSSVPERVNIVLIQPKQEFTIITTGAKPMPPAPPEEAILEQPEKIPQASKNRVGIKPAPAPSGKRASKQTIKDKVTKHKRVHEAETISQSLDKANLTLLGTSTQVERQPEIATLATGNNPDSSQLFDK